MAKGSKKRSAKAQTPKPAASPEFKAGEAAHAAGINADHCPYPDEPGRSQWVHGWYAREARVQAARRAKAGARV